jgi:hypothetical protein
MNLVASGSYPYVQFQPSETSGVQHTDQEFTGSNGNSYLFRTYNAYYDAANSRWETLTSGVSEAYATVQNPDGSIHYYWNGGSSPWTEWLGSDNNTVYNAEDFGAATSGTASGNTAALAALFTAMTNAELPGGMTWIPQYNFPVNASTNGLSVSNQAIIQGLGTGGQTGSTEAFHFSINDSSSAGIFFSCNGTHTSGGTFFKNLAFQWVNPGYAGDTCLYLNYWNNGVDSCTFTDCPIAMNFQGLGDSATRCTISYGVNIATPANTTAIVMAGHQCEVSGPSEMSGGALSGSTSATFCSIGGGVSNCNHNTFRNLHIYGWDYGIDYSDINDVIAPTHSGTQNTVIDGCHMEIFKTCVYMTPYDNSGQIFNQTIVNCNLQKGQNSTDGSPVVFIDSNGGTPTNIGPILLVNNLIFSNVTSAGNNSGVAQNNQYGVQIGSCAAVSIIGGQISQMGGNNGTTGTANICISGAPTLVTIDGVNLSATYAGANSGNATGTKGSAASYYGLLISGAAGTVTVDNCSFAGCTVPVAVTGSVTELLVTNCPGYNDQNITINTLANISTGTAYQAANQGAHGGTSYFGPSFVMFTAHANGGTFQYNGGTAQTLLPSQVVCLTLASPYDTIQFNTHKPAAFAWIGK